MIRETKDTNNVKINIYFKDGSIMLERDIPSLPFTANEKFVCCWIEDVLRFYPIINIDYIDFIYSEDSIDGDD